MYGNSNELEYSIEAKLTRYYFYKGRFDISIFVEDTDKEYEYEEIFEEIIPQIKNVGIFPLGGKLFLEKAFPIVNNDEDKVFFIADGDFDLLLNRKRVEEDNFIYLKKYNIESYLLNKQAVIKYMRPRMKKIKFQTEEIVDFELWEESVIPFLKRVFALHLIVQKTVPEIKNVSRGAAFFLNKKGFPAEENFIKYLEEVKIKIPDAKEKIDSQIAELERVYGKEPGCFICGKYLIESLARYLNSKPVNKKHSYEDLKAFLISNIDKNELDYLKDRIIMYMSV